MLMSFAFCHLFSMTSVISNFILYGLLNDNFKQVRPIDYTANEYILKYLFSVELVVASSQNFKQEKPLLYEGFKLLFFMMI